jgi:glycosyltransferase involved in cell wall biosynthesis
MATPPLKILLEMRPALDGHAGIPQATRLLFRGLCLIDGVSVEGLLQSSTHALGLGLPTHRRFWRRLLRPDQQLDQMARVIITLEQKSWDSYITVIPMVLRHVTGRAEPLTRFEALHFRDFVWRRLFARSLPAEDFDVVTSANFRIARVPWSVMQRCALATRRMGYELYSRLDTSDFDVMITETPYPATVSKRTRLVVRYHDAVPLLMPHTISDRKYHQAYHYRALRRNVESGASFVCVSESTRQDLLSIFPEVERRSLTIHNMVSPHYFEENSSPDRVLGILKTRLNTQLDPPLDASIKRKLFHDMGAGAAPPFLLVVATIEPRKNHLTVLAAWEELQAAAFPGLKLVLVGAFGWHHKAIVERFRPWIEHGEVFMLEDVPSPELRVLYKHAQVTICPSVAEGFDFAGVEAMASGGAVVASEIRVHREIYSDAAEYFNPYSAHDLVRAVAAVIDPSSALYREELLRRGARIWKAYSHDAILPKWTAFLTCGNASGYERAEP